MSKDLRPTIAQQEFVNCLDRSILLQASVGTGKTFALTHRVAKAIEVGIAPERILCVTFTNRAADEMRGRLELYCPEASHKVVTRTFHGLCAWMLRQGARQLGIPQDFGIVDEDDAQEIINMLQISELLPTSASAIYETIQKAKIGGDQRVLRDETLKKVVALYQQELRALNGLDFGDLIAESRKALAPDGPLWEEWSGRFDLVQVDEMQDTHMAEYEVIARLAQKSGNLVLAGDFDQIIYEWRGSTPKQVIARFNEDFPEALPMKFTENHRSTRTLISVSQAVVASYGGTPAQPVRTAVVGKPVIIHGVYNEEGEAQWIGRTIRSLHGQGIPYDKIGVLCRSNNRASIVAEGLQRQGVPHLTVEAYEFFRRQEVKDILANLRFLLNPEDSVSLRRMLRRPAQGIGDQTLRRIEAMQKTGLRLTDLASLDTLTFGDPFARLVSAFEQGTVVVFDCETTGVDSLTDDVVELAAYKIHRGNHVETFHQYLRPTKSVGSSVYVHGLTDEFLREHGQDPKAVLAEFAQFVQGGVLVGHNVEFDRRMVERGSRRYGVPFSKAIYFDTLSLAKRFVMAKSYGLGNLAELLKLANQPTHRAEADVATTFSLLQYLIPKVKRDLDQRSEFIRLVTPAFWDLAKRIARWRELMLVLRPGELIKEVVTESGLGAYYQEEPKRLRNLAELILTAQKLDDQALLPVQALESFVNFAALARNIDRLNLEEQVLCITVHQAKGLEFDVVFLAGLSEYEFPNYGALKDGREREERRLFYVAVTRAKEQLFISYYRSKQGRSRGPSSYLRLIPQNVVERFG